MEYRIATVDEVAKQFDWLIDTHENKEQWQEWKNCFIRRINNGTYVPYYGFIGDTCICEAYAVYKTTNIPELTENNKIYFTAFRTRPEYRNQGYFSKLYRFMLDDLQKKGYNTFTIGVESTELENKLRYTHWGFTKYITSEVDEYSDGSMHIIEYYEKVI